MAYHTNRTVDNTPSTETLDTSIVLKLLQTPERIVFSLGEEQITCADLIATARGLADQLSQNNLQPGSPVILYMGQNVLVAAGMLGILIAGGCVVPVNPDLPNHRRQAILNDVSADFLVSTEANMAPDLNAHKIVFKRCAAVNYEFTTKNVVHHTAENLAFIIYTSGTTGVAKGVEITHHAYLSRLLAVVEHNPTNSFAVDLVWTPASFIGFIDEICFPIFVGCRAVIAHTNFHQDPHGFANFVNKEGVTLCRMAPSVLSMFLRSGIASSLESLNMVIASGEVLSIGTQRLFFELMPHAQLLGFYGATEAPGVGKHVYNINNPALETTQVDVQNFVSLRIMTPESRDVEYGETGEIWLGGSTIARGYWQKEAETRRKFVEMDAKRWYKTGDLGRFLNNGRVEILGRADKTEVNINAIRVNIIEVQRAILELEEIEEAHVDAVQLGRDDNMSIVCHFISAHNPYLDTKSLRRRLMSRLPLAAIPRYFFAHQHFPITANGKLDPLALMRTVYEYSSKVELALSKVQDAEAELCQEHQTSSTISPKETVEITLSKIWCTILKLTSVSRHDDFFDLGGDSLAFVQMVLEVERVCKTSVPSNFSSKTISLEMLACLVISGRHDLQLQISANNSSQQQEHDSLQEMSWPEVRRRLMLASFAWEGKDIGRLLPIQIFNKNGTQSPLFWCFNGASEPIAMARELGPDQPLYVLRSMQSVVEHDQKHIYLDDLVREYTQEILAIWSAGPFLLGGNCQAGFIMEGVARRLALSGHSVGHVFFLEYEPEKAIDIDVSLFFGRDSKEYNPFFRKGYNPFTRKKRPEKRWKSIFRTVSWDIVPGGHSQYFSPKFVKHFIGELSIRLRHAHRKHEIGVMELKNRDTS
jgi:acyl-CoA synthetase (AMP-forming)/AMP-acid ligase II/acyl carrier protein